MRWFLLSLLLLTSCALFQRTPLIPPAQEMAKLRETYQLPALAAALSLENQMMFQEAQGLRKLNVSIPVSSEDKFHLGSCTKAMTATLVARFIERDEFTWASPLSTLLPHIKLHENVKDITIEELLSHTAGLSANPDSQTIARLRKRDAKLARRELAQMFLMQPPEFSRKEYHYSNIGYIILGHVLETRTHRSWEELLVREVFKPLGMKSCGFGVTSSSKESSPSQPWGHESNAGKFSPRQADNAAFYGPAGTVHCSLGDWQKFVQLHVQGFNGESSFLKAETFQKLHTTPSSSPTYTYGGWVRLERAWALGPVFTHSGTNTYNYATVWWAPKKNAIIVGTTNSFSESSHEAMDKMVTNLVRTFLTK